MYDYSLPICVSVQHMHAHKDRRECHIPWDCCGSCESSCGYWELNLGALQEQQVNFTPEPSPQLTPTHSHPFKTNSQLCVSFPCVSLMYSTLSLVGARVWWIKVNTAVKVFYSQLVNNGIAHSYTGRRGWAGIARDIKNAFLAKGQESSIRAFFPLQIVHIFLSLIIQKQLNRKTSSVIYISPWWELACKNHFTYVEFKVFYLLGVNFSFHGRAPWSPYRQYHFYQASGNSFTNLRFHFWKIKLSVHFFWKNQVVTIKGFLWV